MDLNKSIKFFEDYHLSSLFNTAEYFKNITLKVAVYEASSSIESLNKNKMFSHQRRIGKGITNKGAEKMLEKIDEIGKCKTFDEVFLITEEVRKSIFKLGHLWSYDTALRIGFNLNLYPDKVYIQSGVKNGLKKIFKEKTPRGRTLPKNIFPLQLQKLEPYMIENFLCIYGKNKY